MRTDLEFTLSNRHAEFRVNGPDAWIEGDELRLKQVIENLVSNAVKYNDKPAPVIEAEIVAWPQLPHRTRP